MDKKERDFQGVRLASLGFATYADYLQSDHWKEIRQQFISSGRSTCCDLCQDWKQGFQLHHKTYARIGNEKLTDLVPLCRSCHAKVHLFLKANDKPLYMTSWAIMRMRMAKWHQRDKLADCFPSSESR